MCGAVVLFSFLFVTAMSLPPKTVHALVQTVLRDPEVGPPKMLSHAWKPAILTVLVCIKPNTGETDKSKETR